MNSWFDLISQQKDLIYDSEKGYLGECGIIKLRHYLNDQLKKYGGNIGYAIRPSKRNCGYGRVMLKLVIDEARAKGLNKILITTNNKNISSQ